MFKASKLDREAWRRVVAVLTDPAVITVGEKGRDQLDRTEAEARGLERLVAGARAKEANFAERLGEDVSGPALQTVLAKLNEAVTERAALEERLAEVEGAAAPAEPSRRRRFAGGWKASWKPPRS